MKERLIKWTRSEKNERICLAITYTILGITAFFILGIKADWGRSELTVIEGIVSTFILYTVFLGFVITKNFFELEDDTIRKNKIRVIIFSNEDVWLLLLLFFILPIIGIIANLGYMILAVILMVVVIFSVSTISDTISGFFKKKLK